MAAICGLRGAGGIGPLRGFRPSRDYTRPVEAGPSVECGRLCGAVWTESEPELPKCQSCKAVALSGELQCELCRCHRHSSCLPAEQTTQGLAIPWHCSCCRASLQRNGVADVTLDAPLLRYLATGKPPPVAEAGQRVIKTARWLRLDSASRLWATHDVLGWQRRIPPLGERLAILREASRNMGFPGGDKLYEHVRLHYY